MPLTSSHFSPLVCAAKTTVPSSRRFLVGCIKVDKVSATNCDVGMFAVDPERQGGGMGKMLLQAAEVRRLLLHCCYMSFVSERVRCCAEPCALKVWSHGR